ncbi:MAG: CotH kinase family protein [Firmicutes bacterium]|nr:CotH kinase family protein [Bacillota bacterium]
MIKFCFLVLLLTVLAACERNQDNTLPAEIMTPEAFCELPPLPAAATEDESTVYPEYNYPAFDFPSLFISTPEHPFRQPRNHWQRDSTLTMTGTCPELSFYNVPVRIRGRGNTTWRHGPDKRPLRIRFETPQPMFGSEHAHRDWILLANHFDRSLLRNMGALYFGGLLTNMAWTPSSSYFVHLYINGKYYGVYQLTDERHVEPGRVELTADPDPAVSEYFLELNGHVIGWRSNEFTEDVDYFIINSRAYELRWPSGDARTDAHFEYVQSYIQRVSDAIRAQNWQQITNLIDIPSFVDFYIVQEFFKNTDISRFGVFMQIKGQDENRRLHLGPVWDFDQSSGNNNRVENPRGRLAANHNYWFNYLMQTPAFKQAAADRWDEIKLTYIPQTIDHIYRMAITYEQDFNRNFERHPYIMGDIFEWNWVPSYATAGIDTFMGQVEFLIDFLTLRKQWMDDFLHDRLPEDEEIEEDEVLFDKPLSYILV